MISMNKKWFVVFREVQWKVSTNEYGNLPYKGELDNPYRNYVGYDHL